MGEIRQIDDRNIENAEECIVRAGLSVSHVDPAGRDYPVRMRQAAGCHGAADDAKLVRSTLDDDLPREEERIRRGVDHFFPAYVFAHADATGDVVEAPGVEVEIVRGMFREDVFIGGATIEFDVSFGASLAG